VLSWPSSLGVEVGARQLLESPPSFGVSSGEGWRIPNGVLGTQTLSQRSPICPGSFALPPPPPFGVTNSKMTLLACSFSRCHIRTAGARGSGRPVPDLLLRSTTPRRPQGERGQSGLLRNNIRFILSEIPVWLPQRGRHGNKRHFWTGQPITNF